MATLNAQNSTVSFYMSGAGHVVPDTAFLGTTTDFSWRTVGVPPTPVAAPIPNLLSAAGAGFTYSGGLPTGGTVTSVTIDLLGDASNDVFISMNGANVAGGLPGLFPTLGTAEERAQKFWSAILSGDDTVISSQTGSGDMTGDFFQVVSTLTTIADLTGGDDKMSSNSLVNPTGTLVRRAGPDALTGDAFFMEGTTFNSFLFAATLTGGNDEIRLTGFAGLAAIGDVRTVGNYSFLTGGADILISNVRGALGPPSGFKSAPQLTGDAYEVSKEGSVAGGADRIIGTNYAFLPDTISGDVYLSSGFVTGGRDTLEGRAGQDRIAGDVFFMRGGTIWGGSDVIRGGGDSDVIAGDVYEIAPSGGIISLAAEPAGGPIEPPALEFRGGNDFIYGDAGNDIIAGDVLEGSVDADAFIQNGNDTIFGGDDDDQLFGDSLLTSLSSANPQGGDDVLDGGLGDDYLDGQGGSDTAAFNSILAAVTVNLATGVATGQGTDTLIRIENLLGSALSDTLRGDNFANRFTGGLGNDTIDGAGGNDTANYFEKTAAVSVALAGASLVNVFVGGAVEDRIRNVENIIGGSGNDSIFGDTFANAFTGGAGNDRLQGAGGADAIDGGIGVDEAIYGEKSLGVSVTLAGSAWATVFVGGVAEDQLRFIENILGGAGNDTLIGDASVNDLYGNGGNDLIRGGAGKDVLNGFSGVDTADYSDKTASVDATLNGASTAFVKVNGVIEDAISNFENLIGGSKADTLTGDAAANRLEGGAGNDILNGEANNDTLTGGLGVDTLTGGVGADRFQFLSFSGGADVIKDFQHLTDDIVISRAGFDPTLALGALSATRLVANLNPSASLGVGQFLYETDTGKLSWDSDGAGAAAPVQIALLQGSPAFPVLTNADFVVIA
jgi:Ca2+-binding RTX toxin-like protein